MRFVIDLCRCRKTHPPIPHTIFAKLDITFVAWSHTFKPQSWKKNPGRWFFGCPKFGTGEQHCRFFEWFDALFCEGCCNLIHVLITQNELLGHELWNKDATIRRLQFSVVALCALLFKIMLAISRGVKWAKCFTSKLGLSSHKLDSGSTQILNEAFREHKS